MHLVMALVKGKTKYVSCFWEQKLNSMNKQLKSNGRSSNPMFGKIALRAKLR